MSAESQAINPAAFAEALKALPLSAVYGKVLELRNSIAHLDRSNEELRTYIRESEGGPGAADNKELEGYILENEGVIRAMTERLALLKAEIENRGQRWIEEGEGPEEAVGDIADGVPDGDGASPVINGTDRHDPSTDGTSTTAETRHSGPINGVHAPNSDSSASVAPANVRDRQSEVEMEEEGIHL
jgi:hypothetical protein